MGTNKEEALRWVHLYAIGGAALAMLPLPMSTTAGLSTLETHLVKRISALYGCPLGAKAIAGAGTMFLLVGRGLKRIAKGAGSKVPLLRVPIRMAIAAGAVESIGRAAVRYFEQNHPHPTG